MKIAILSLLNGTVNRGVESWAIQITNEFQRQGHVCTLVQGGSAIDNRLSGSTFVLPTAAKDESGNRALTFRLLRRFGLSSIDFSVKEFYRKSIEFLAQEKFDIVIPVSGHGKYLRSLLKSESIRAKLILVGHAGFDPAVTAADGFVALSARDARQVKERSPDLPVLETFNGVDIDQFRNASSVAGLVEQLELKKNRTLLCVAALVPYKRVNRILEALQRLSGYTLIIIGSGPERKNLVEAAQKDLNNTYHFFEGISFDQMPSYYGVADIFIHAADESEAFGSVIVEAMAAGCKVLINDDPIRRDIVGGDSSWITKFHDPAIVAAKIQKMTYSDPPERDLLLEAARRFSWDRIAGEYLKFFKGILESDR